MTLSKRKPPYLEVFIIAFFISMSFLLPYMIMDKGLFLFFGDYDVQQVPFYMLVHDAIRSGNVLWSWTTDLGSNFISSYSFYNLGSPFFWLTIPLPNSWVPYTLGPLLALKMSFAAVTGFAFINRFVKTYEIAALGALLYAFSSYTIYNIFFNHFLELMVFFPLLLIGLEEYMKNDRKGVFALIVFINAFVNYNFFFGEVVFVIIYWLLRMTSGEWKLTFKKFGFLAFEAVTGVGISCVLLIPSVVAIAGNYRTGQLLTGWNLLVYDNNQRLPDILHSLFFPQDLPSRPNFFPDANNKWASIAAWLPMFSLSGALAFSFAKKGHWLKRILGVSLLMALVPGLNSLFMMLNSEYYARWFYMPVLMLCLATAIALEDPTVNLKAGLFWTGLITLAFALMIGLVPNKTDSGVIKIGLEGYPFRFWVFVLIAILGLLVTFILIEKYGKNTLAFANTATIALTVVVCIYANFFIATGKTYGYDGSWFKATAVDGGQQLNLDRSTFFRVDVLDGIDNQAMFWGLPNIQAFQSTVSDSILQFYPTVGVSRDVASRPQIILAGLRPFLSVKYLFDADNSPSLPIPGWVYDSEQLGFKVWKNENYVPMGFTFDYYISKANFDRSISKDRMLLKAIELSVAQISDYSDILKPLPDDLSTNFSDNAMAQDCADLRSSSCSTFNTNNGGFSATISLNNDNLVFFSVPYDNGWTATVNGKPAKIEKVDTGFMAVKCTAGNNSIRFNYMPPGLKIGAIITGASIAALALYLLLFNVVLKKKRRIVPVENSYALDDDLSDDYDNYPDGDEG